jgi:hypothetical protein
MKIIFILVFLFIIYIIYNNNKENFTNSLKKTLKWNDNSTKNLNVNSLHCGNTKTLSEIDNKHILMAYNYDNINPDDTHDISRLYNNINQKYGEDNNQIINNVLSNQPLHFSLNIIHDEIKYNLLGYAINKYYDQNYLIYEYHITENNNYYLKDNLEFLESQLYKYVLVKTRDDKSEVIHVFGPRSKINIGDIVNLSYGVYQLGPLEIKKYN